MKVLCCEVDQLRELADPARLPYGRKARRRGGFVQEWVEVYPLSQRDNPPAMVFISGSRKPWNTIHASDFDFFEELHTVIDREPTSMLDPEMLGLFASIGIEKGKPFAPDKKSGARQTFSVGVGRLRMPTPISLWSVRD